MTETLLVHGADYSEEELLVGADVQEELGLCAGDFVELSLKEPTLALVMRINSTVTAKSLRVSLLRSVADSFGLTARQPVELHVVSASEAALDWVELTFKDQHLSRGDIWHFRRHVIKHQPTMYPGKTITFESIRAQS